MNTKGSIAVLALAAAFCGQAVAQQTCRELLGAQGFMNNAPTGAWLVAQEAAGWKSGKFVNPCVIPKNKKETLNIEEATDANLCSTYNTLFSADQKYIAPGGTKVMEAVDMLDTYLYSNKKLTAWYGAGKVDQTTYEAVFAKVKEARDCIAAGK